MTQSIVLAAALLAALGCMPDLVTAPTSAPKSCEPVFIWTCPSTPTVPTTPPLVEGLADLGIAVTMPFGFSNRAPVWSADGSALFIVGSNIEAVDVQGTRRVVATGEPMMGALRISESGQILHFTTLDDVPTGQCGLYRAGAPGEPATRLATVSGAYPCEFQISPDARYVTTSNGIHDLVLGTTHAINLGRSPDDASASGALVAVLPWEVAPSRVRTLSVADGALREVWTARNSSVVQRRLLDLRWRGETLELVVLIDSAATGLGQGTHSIRVVDTDTGEEREVAAVSVSGPEVEAASWSADGRALALWAKDIETGNTKSSLYLIATDGAPTDAAAPGSVVARPFWAGGPGMLSISSDARTIATMYRGVLRIKSVQ